MVLKKNAHLAHLSSLFGSVSSSLVLVTWSKSTSHILFFDGETWQRNCFLSIKAVSLWKQSQVNDTSTQFKHEHGNSQETEFCIWFQLTKHKLYLTFYSLPFPQMDDSQPWKYSREWFRDEKENSSFQIVQLALFLWSLLFAHNDLYLKGMNALTF